MILVEIFNVIKHMPQKPQATTRSMLSYIFQLLRCRPSQKSSWTLYSKDGTGGHFWCLAHGLIWLWASTCKQQAYYTYIFQQNQAIL